MILDHTNQFVISKDESEGFPWILFQISIKDGVTFAGVVTRQATKEVMLQFIQNYSRVFNNHLRPSLSVDLIDNKLMFTDRLTSETIVVDIATV